MGSPPGRSPRQNCRGGFRRQQQRLRRRRQQTKKGSTAVSETLSTCEIRKFLSTSASHACWWLPRYSFPTRQQTADCRGLAAAPPAVSSDGKRPSVNAAAAEGTTQRNGKRSLNALKPPAIAAADFATPSAATAASAAASWALLPPSASKITADTSRRRRSGAPLVPSGCSSSSCPSSSTLI